MISIFRIGQIYKIQLREREVDDRPITYTAEILEEDSIQIKVRARSGEELILNKSEIRQSKLHSNPENKVHTDVSYN